AIRPACAVPKVVYWIRLSDNCNNRTQIFFRLPRPVIEHAPNRADDGGNSERVGSGPSRDVGDAKDRGGGGHRTSVEGSINRVDLPVDGAGNGSTTAGPRNEPQGDRAAGEVRRGCNFDSGTHSG